jgi:phage repressor protein C with HTH and peptisase S24 domain
MYYIRDMRTLAERLVWARERQALTQEGLAKLAGVSQGTIGNLESGSRQSARKIVEIAAALKVDAGWLAGGKGAAVPGDDTSTSGQPIRALHADDPLPDDVVQVPESRIEFSAGNGKTATFELVEDGEPAIYRRSWLQKNGLKPEHIRRFPVSGDSQEPILYDGDVVLVNLDETEVVDGKLYAIRYDNDLRIKFLFRKLDGTLILRSKNPAYPDEEVPPNVANEYISIIGRVRDKSGKGGL